MALLCVYSTLTGVAVILILPHDTASSGLAPESLPSNSCPVFTNTEKSAPLRWEDKQKKTSIHLNNSLVTQWQPEETADSRWHRQFPRETTSQWGTSEEIPYNFQPIRSTTEIWVVTRHQYALISPGQTSLRGETSGDLEKCGLFSQARHLRHLPFGENNGREKSNICVFHGKSFGCLQSGVQQQSVRDS